jgi:glycosyltransferase involved in cell wall biosynthesis
MRKPSILVVGRTRYRLPLAPGTAAKFDALGAQLRVHVLASAASGSRGTAGGFTLVGPLRPSALDGLVFWLSLPWRVSRLLRRLEPEVVFAQSPYEGAAVLIARSLTGSQVRIVVEIHGDWRTATRLYGSRLRRLAYPLSPLVARSALRRADAVRTVGPFTTSLVRELGIEPAATFTTFSELSAFSRTPPMSLPDRPTLLFVGVLERYKDVRTLSAAWRRVALRVPEARLHVVGRGREHEVVEQLLADLPAQTSWSERLPPDEVAAALDASTALALPSRSEGLPRVAIEAFARGRPVIGSAAGGIPDIVDDGVNGLLVSPGDVEALAEAITRVLTDAALARRLAEGAADSARRWLVSPEGYAARMRTLVDDVTA